MRGKCATGISDCGRMLIKFHIDPVTGQPHIFDHGVTEEEVRDIMAHPRLVLRGRKNSRFALGQTRSGRYLKVAFVPRSAKGGGILNCDCLRFARERVEGVSSAQAEAIPMNKTKKHKYPAGWSEKKIRELIAYYDNQTEDVGAAEIDS